MSNPKTRLNIAAEHTLSRQDQRHLLVFSALWELPIGEDEDSPKQTPTTPNWPARILSHIELAPIATVGSGRAVNALTGVDSNLSDAFPLSSRPLGFNRDSLRTPGLANVDFRVLKYCPFGKTAHLDVVAEFFNLFNHSDVVQSNPIFGSNVAPIANFGQPIEGAGARRSWTPCAARAPGAFAGPSTAYRGPLAGSRRRPRSAWRRPRRAG